MKEIGTVTLNPSFDLHWTVPDFEPGKENLVTAAETEAGGKGINTSRALCANGIKNTAYVIAGKENGALFTDLLEKDGLTLRVFETEGRIRENLTVHPSAGKETRISLNTFSVPEPVLDALEKELLSRPLSGMLISFAGRIPEGLRKERVIKMLKALSDGGAELAVDCASLSPCDLEKLVPWFIKPNEQEIKSFFRSAPEGIEDAAEAAKKLVLSGFCRTAMVTLGGDGAAWSDGKDAYILRVPRLSSPLSTVGAGDSTVAGMLAGTARGLPLAQTLRLAAAYGTAACMTPGTRPPRPEDIERLLPQTVLEKI